MQKFLTYGLLIALLSVGGSCVATKKKGDISKGKRFYHNLTSKYNYWFNANEMYNLTLLKMTEQHVDNYNKLLEVYPYMAIDPQPTKGDWDNVIKKCASAISLHRQGDWPDDCYLLVGQAQYLKQDFETAENTFKFIKEEFAPSSKKAKLKSDSKKKLSKKQLKRKKKKELKKKQKQKKATAKAKEKAKEQAKKDKAAGKVTEKTTPQPATPAVKTVPKDSKKDTKLSLSDPYKKRGRRSAYPIAMVWYARTLVEREKYDEAEFMLRDLSEDTHFNKTERTELNIAEANLWMKQQKYDRAIGPLARAIDLMDKGKDRSRLAFLLAQLYNRTGQYDQAYATLSKVLRGSSSYELTFNATLMQLRAGWSNGTLKSSEAIRDLERLAKDTKNFDYRDQIYFVMAEIALADRQQKEAIAYLRKSLQYNKSNVSQKVESYLKLADLYFEDEDFVQAKNYYDSTLAVLPNTDERYKRVTAYATNLTDIARNITTINTNDSLISIYNMTDAQRKELAKTIKKRQRAELAAAEAAAAAADKNNNGANNITPVAGVKSNFYFYNSALVKRGKRDFERIWGNRKLEDNWRRSQRTKEGVSGAADDLAATAATTDEVTENDISNIFQGVPRSAAELTVLHANTYDAMFNLGKLFRDKLQNNRRSINTHEDMQRRYPDSLRFDKETWYYCYLGHTDLGNAARAKVYLDKLLDKYPNSPYTRTLVDPNFISQNKSRELELDRFYAGTFDLFQKGQYKEAIERSKEAPTKYGTTNPLMPKFALLSALCIGNLQGNEAYCAALNDLIGNYPESAEATRAKEIARVLSCKGFETTPGSAPPADINMGGTGDKPAFIREDDKQHYILIALYGDDIRIDDVKVAISDYNREFHKTEPLRVSVMYLGTETNTPVVVMRKFDNREQVLRYYKEVAGRKEFLGETDKKTYKKDIFAISQENYRTILKNKSLVGYAEFFKTNYLD
jgi:tetratricopeptide (TPR) repeat protein